MNVLGQLLMVAAEWLPVWRGPAIAALVALILGVVAFTVEFYDA